MCKHLPFKIPAPTSTCVVPTITVRLLFSVAEEQFWVITGPWYFCRTWISYFYVLATKSRLLLKESSLPHPKLAVSLMSLYVLSMVTVINLEMIDYIPQIMAMAFHCRTFNYWKNVHAIIILALNINRQRSIEKHNKSVLKI